jgi:hypothetical protein
MKSRLDQISTHPDIKVASGRPPDPRKIVPQLVSRYQKAIRKYLGSILRQAGAGHVEDAYQDLYLAALASELGVLDENERFRDLLKKAVRRAARPYQGKRPGQLDESLDVAGMSHDDEWVATWRDELLRKALEDLDAFEKRKRATAHQNNYATVVRLRMTNPKEKGTTLAERLCISHDRFRKDLSLARRKLVEFLRAEVRKTEPRWTDEEIDDELCALGLRAILQAFGQDRDVGD